MFTSKNWTEEEVSRQNDAKQNIQLSLTWDNQWEWGVFVILFVYMKKFILSNMESWKAKYYFRRTLPKVTLDCDDNNECKLYTNISLPDVVFFSVASLIVCVNIALAWIYQWNHANQKQKDRNPH